LNSSTQLRLRDGQQRVSMSFWIWAKAAVCGTAHLRKNLPLQDSVFAFSGITARGRDFFCGVLSDGAGSAMFGKQGASIVCRSLSSLVRAHFRSEDDFPNEDLIVQWIDKARDRIFIAAERRDLTPRDFAATLVMVICIEDRSQIIHIGDGSVALQSSLSQEWIVPSWPNNGEFASSTYFITDESLSQLRSLVADCSISRLVMFSDGLERLALDFRAATAFTPFCDAMSKPLLNSSADGEDSSLSAALGDYLQGDAVNERTDDDKSLVIAVRR